MAVAASPKHTPESLRIGIEMAGKGAIVPSTHPIGQWLGAPSMMDGQRGMCNGDVWRVTRQYGRDGSSTWRMGAKRVPTLIKAFLDAPPGASEVQILGPPDGARGGLGVAVRAECVICLEEGADHTCVPCGHVCLCSECLPLRGQCPICNAPVRDVIKVFQV